MALAPSIFSLPGILVDANSVNMPPGSAAHARSLLGQLPLAIFGTLQVLLQMKFESVVPVFFPSLLPMLTDLRRFTGAHVAVMPDVAGCLDQ